MSSGSSASTEIIESRDQMNSSNGNSCGPTVLETKLTLRDKSTTLKLSSKISVSKSEDSAGVLVSYLCKKKRYGCLVILIVKKWTYEGPETVTLSHYSIKVRRLSDVKMLKHILKSTKLLVRLFYKQYWKN